MTPAVERLSRGLGWGGVPSYPIGLSVARTTNGLGSGRVTPSTLTWPSAMASSSAAWVFGGGRLISSASSRAVNTGPGRKGRPHPGEGGRQHARGELARGNPQPQHGRERAGQQRLTQPGQVLDQDVTGGQHP